MYSFADNYESKLQEIEAEIEAGTHFEKEYLDVLPLNISQKYIQKCSENPVYEVGVWIYNQFTEKQKNAFHKALIKCKYEIDSEIVKLLPEDIRQKWLVNYLENVDYIPHGVILDKEIHADIINKIYKNAKKRGVFPNTQVFNLLSPELKIDYILHEGSKAIGQDAVNWLKNFKKANTREELFKIIIEQ
jgi:hypothetical protein